MCSLAVVSSPCYNGRVCDCPVSLMPGVGETMSAFASLGRRTVGLVVAAACCGPALAQPTSAPPSAPRAFLDATCMKCHSEEAESAMALFSGFFLDRLDVDDIAAHPAEWEKVVRKLRTGMMPPASEPRPDEAERQSFIAYLEGALDELAARSPNPGRPALHRLNRTEYANAIHDLLGLDVDAAELLPGDDASFGFDNVAGSLGVSPVLVERYANAAARIARLAVGDVAMTAEQKTHYVPNFLMQGEHIAGLPFGTRGGVRVEHFFPLDAEYLINVDLMSAVNGIHIGNGIPNEQLEVTLDGRRMALFDISKPPPKPAPPEAGAAEGGARERGASRAAAGGRERGKGRPTVGGAHSRQRGTARAGRGFHQEEPRPHRGRRATAEQHAARSVVQRHAGSHADRARRQHHRRRPVCGVRSRHDAEPRAYLHLRAAASERRGRVRARDPVDDRLSGVSAAARRRSTSPC